MIICVEKEMNELEDQAKMDKKRGIKGLKEKTEEKAEKTKDEKAEKKAEALEEVEDVNRLDKQLQTKLRKNQYNFQRADEVCRKTWDRINGPVQGPLQQTEAGQLSNTFICLKTRLNYCGVF